MPNIAAPISPVLKSTRDGFGDALLELAKDNKNIVVLSADLAESTRTHIFSKEFPDRFIEVGVAEQNMAGIGAGLALSGKIPFITSYAVFSPGRNWDQLRISVCYSKANVKMIGSHAGLSTGPDGATHQGLEDIALMRVLPNMVVLCPVDYVDTKKAVHAAVEHYGPVYIRLAREGTPIITDEKTSYGIGRASILKEGTDLTIIGCGPVLHQALIAAHELERMYKISCDVINCFSVKPLDTETILASVNKTKRVLTIEEHQVAGGIGSAVCELLADKLPVPVRRLGINDSFGESGNYMELLTKHRLDASSILLEIRNLF